MGQAVVHFEVVGKDGEGLRRYYGELFGWNIDANNPMQYGMVDGKDNKTANGDTGIGGGVGQGPEATRAMPPSTSRCPTSSRRCRRPRASAAPV
jgi:predicted enzyme related to lactoylglutathione lyase